MTVAGTVTAVDMRPWASASTWLMIRWPVRSPKPISSRAFITKPSISSVTSVPRAPILGTMRIADSAGGGEAGRSVSLASDSASGVSYTHAVAHKSTANVASHRIVPHLSLPTLGPTFGSRLSHCRRRDLGVGGDSPRHALLALSSFRPGGQSAVAETGVTVPDLAGVAHALSVALIITPLSEEV